MRPSIHIVAFVGIFLMVYVVLYLLTRMLHRAIKETKLEMMDRVLGGVLGAVKMAAGVSCVCAVLTALALPLFQEWFEQSTLAPFFAHGTEVVMSWIPQDLIATRRTKASTRCAISSRKRSPTPPSTR